MPRLVLILIIASLAAFAAVVSAAGVSPIWMAPTNLNYPDSFPVDSFNEDVFENFTANLGEWATVEVATGARGSRPLVLVDSKGTLWIMGGSPERRSNYYLTAVWNYNPKTDQYRYVWKTNNSSPFVARNEGELRVPAPSNHPGGIGYQAAVIDKNDNIWLPSYEFPGEVWMFNTTSWMFVRQFGFYNETFSPSIGANPGQPGEDVWPGVAEGQCMVIDSQENIWLLAGTNFYRGSMNAVWHFNTTSLLWTYITGSITSMDMAHNSTFYGGTWMPGCDIDENDRVWIFGGWGRFDASSTDDYGHLWTFDTRVKREWEFEYGADAYQAKPQVVSEDYHADNRPPACEGAALIDRRDGTLMVAPSTAYLPDGNWGASDTVWLYSKSLKQWKLGYGNISAYDYEGKFSNYHAPGSARHAGIYFGYSTGRNTNGDLYIVGGGTTLYIDWASNYKDIWLIPQDQCANNIHKCDVNADCIEEMIGYSCKCKDGYTGDGFVCVGPPVADVPNTPSKKTSSAEHIGASVAAALVAVLSL